MTTADPAASQQAVVDVALLLLERMGMSPSDLVAVPRERPVLPTFAEYIPAAPPPGPLAGQRPARLAAAGRATHSSSTRS